MNKHFKCKSVGILVRKKPLVKITYRLNSVCKIESACWVIQECPYSDQSSAMNLNATDKWRNVLYAVSSWLWEIGPVLLFEPDVCLHIAANVWTLGILFNVSVGHWEFPRKGNGAVVKLTPPEKCRLWNGAKNFLAFYFS